MHRSNADIAEVHHVPFWRARVLLEVTLHELVCKRESKFTNSSTPENYSTKKDVDVGNREILGLLNHFPNGVGACNVAAAAKVQIKFHQLCVATFTSQMKTTRTVSIDTGAHTLHFVHSFFVY